MTDYYSRRRLTRALILTCFAMAADISVARAEPSRADLMGLARNFVDRIGQGFDRADNFLAASDGGAAQPQEVDIPDGEILLLQITLNGMRLTDNVFAEKSGDDVLMSLRDFTMIARFPIAIDAEAGRAQGWFIEEDNNFDLDVDAGKLQAGDMIFDVAPDDVRIDGDDILVRGQKLAQWMDFTLNVKYATQSAEIATARLWPVEKELARRQRNIGNRLPPPEQPRLDIPYQWVSTPNVELNVNHAYNRTGSSSQGQNRTYYNLAAAGDLAAHTVRAVVTGNEENPIAATRISFSRQSEEPELLGPLKARSYEFGDIAATRVPLAGSTSTGLGARVSSANPYYTTGTQTQIIGEAMPNWDVELYRNNQLLNMMTVAADGRYVFDNVDLFSGENIFRIVQYGPLGEQREEERRIVSSAHLAGTGGGVYDISVIAADKQIWAHDPIKSAESGDIHIAGMYEQQLNPSTTVRVGARSATRGDERKNFAYAGATQTIGGVLLNADAAYDLDGAFSATASGRKNFGAHSLSLSASYSGENYAAVKDNHIPANYGFRGLLSGPLVRGDHWHVNYSLDSDNRFYDDDSYYYDQKLNLNARTGRFGMGQTFRHLSAKTRNGTERDETTGSTSLRGPAWGVQWRATAHYEIEPELAMRNYILDLTRSINRNIYSNFRLEHAPQAHYTEGKASLSWNAGRAILSPTVTYDSEDNLGVSVNLRTALAHDPASGKTIFTGLPTTSSGGFSAFVYLDRDGSWSYDPDIDELLPDVTIRALHSHRAALTDEKGWAFIHDLPVGRATDVVIDEISLPDAFWVPGFEGVSVQPRPGFVASTQFPIHIAGEIDGTLSMIREGHATPLRGVNLVLYRMDGRQQARALTAPDGFYIFDRVPPGRYLLMLADEDAKRFNLARPQPQEIMIGYDGTIISGNNISVNGDEADVPVGFAAEINKYLALNDRGDELAGQDVILNLGSYRSQLLMGVTWYQIRKRYSALLQGGQLLVAPSQSYAAPQSGLHQLLVAMPGLSLGEAVQRCRAFVARDIVCRVELLPDKDKNRPRIAGITPGEGG